MTKYFLKPKPIDALEIARVGSTSGYFQLVNGSVVQFKGDASDIGEGDMVVFEDGQVTGLMKREAFDQVTMELPEDLNPSDVELMIDAQDFVEAESLTLCVLTLKDGRKVHGTDNAVSGTKDERRELAYHDAFNRLFRYEMFKLQGLQAMFKETTND